MPLNLNYSSGTCVQKHTALQLPEPISIETPWLEITDILVGTFARPKYKMMNEKAYMIFRYDQAKYPDFAQKIASLDGPPNDAPPLSAEKFRYALSGKVRIKVDPWDFDIDDLFDYIEDQEPLQKLDYRGHTISAGDKIQCLLSIKGYGRKCRRLFYTIESCHVRQGDQIRHINCL